MIDNRIFIWLIQSWLLYLFLPYNRSVLCMRACRYFCLMVLIIGAYNYQAPVINVYNINYHIRRTKKKYTAQTDRHDCENTSINLTRIIWYWNLFCQFISAILFGSERLIVSYLIPIIFCEPILCVIFSCTENVVLQHSPLRLARIVFVEHI